MFVRLFILFISVFFNCHLAFGLSKGVDYFKLKNQMEVYVVKDDFLPIVSHTLLYKVGSAHDPKGKSGLAHYLEHLMFRSSQNIENITSKIHSLNAKYNAMTSDYFTIYYQMAPKDRLEEIMKIEAERMQNLKITKLSADLEKKIVLEERRTRFDSKPFSLFAEEMRAALYRNDKSWNTIGWREEILHLDEHDATEMYKEYYKPENAVLILSGDLNERSVKALVEKHYGDIKNTKSVSRIKPEKEPQHRSNISISMKNTINKDRLVSYYFDAPNIAKSEYVAAFVASYILSKGGSGKMHHELVHNLRLAVDVSVDYSYLTKSPGTLCISVLPLNADVRLHSISESIESVIIDILKNGVTRGELETAKTLAKFDLLMLLDGINQKSVWGAIALSVGADFSHYDDLITQIASVSLEQVNSALSNLLSSKRVVGFLE